MEGGGDLLVTDGLFRGPGWEEAQGNQWRLDCCLLLPERSWYCYWLGFLAFLNQWRLIRGQTRNSGMASLGPLQQQRGVKTSDTFPCSFPEEGWAGSSQPGEGRGVSWAWVREVAGLPLRWCWVQGSCAVPCFCSWLFRSGSWVFGLFVSCCPEFVPSAHVHGYF